MLKHEQHKTIQENTELENRYNDLFEKYQKLRDVNAYSPIKTVEAIGRQSLLASRRKNLEKENLLLKNAKDNIETELVKLLKDKSRFQESITEIRSHYEDSISQLNNERTSYQKENFKLQSSFRDLKSETELQNKKMKEELKIIKKNKTKLEKKVFSLKKEVTQRDSKIS